MVVADRRPIDPPPIVQLRLIDHAARRPPGHSSPSRASSPGGYLSRSLSRFAVSHVNVFIDITSLSAHRNYYACSFISNSVHIFSSSYTYESPITGAGSSSNSNSSPLSSQSFPQNPYYFMFASLAKPDEDVETHWTKVTSVILVSDPCALLTHHTKGRENPMHDRLGHVIAIPLKGLRESE